MLRKTITRKDTPKSLEITGIKDKQQIALLMIVFKMEGERRKEETGTAHKKGSKKRKKGRIKRKRKEKTEMS